MHDRPTLADLALTSAADDAVVQSLALIQHTRRNIEATRHLIEQGRQSIERSLERLAGLKRQDGGQYVARAELPASGHLPVLGL